MTTANNKEIVFLDRSTFPKHIKFPVINFNHTWKEYNFTKKKRGKKKNQEREYNRYQ